jgi:hypothetical protein
MAFVPEGRYDRSLARSAWVTAAQEIRPVGYGMIGIAIPDIPMVLLVEDVRRIS